MPDAPRTLAIETATEACSIALFEGDALIAQEHREIGRGHAETLVPMIGTFPDKGRADRILVSLGPGSFTGVRVGLAAARALGIAWGADVLGYPTLALVAAIARAETGLPPEAQDVTVCMNGGHGEWFVQGFDSEGLADGEVSSLLPEAAIASEPHPCIAGNRAREWGEHLSDDRITTFETFPNAAYALRLPQACLTRDLSPIYGRPPDAKPQAAQVKAPSPA